MCLFVNGEGWQIYLLHNGEGRQMGLDLRMVSVGRCLFDNGAGWQMCFDSGAG